MSEYSLMDFKECLEENKFKMNANDFIGTERTLNEFEKEQKEKPRYYVVHEAPQNPDIESWDVRQFDSSYELGYEDVAVFYTIKLPDAEKRAKALCDELNRKEKFMCGMKVQTGCYGNNKRAWDLANKPHHSAKLIIIDDPNIKLNTMELRAKSIARDVASILKLSKDY